MSTRAIHHRYEDPLSRVWLACAARVGYRIVRTPDAFAATDGSQTLLIADDAALDADDSLAQMILHELCHALVEGEGGECQPDWGLDNTSGRDTWREHACLRLQAYLAGSVGLREFFAPTTDFRTRFWDHLPADPLTASPEQGGRLERSCIAARLGAWRAGRPRWREPLLSALDASARIADAAAAFEAADTALPSLWAAAQPRPPMHPAGHAAIADYHRGHGCADCAWGFVNRGHQCCQQVPAKRLPADAPACMSWEPMAELDCQRCGACCREAYDSVEVQPREAVLKRHPALIIDAGSHYKLKRDGDRCAALKVGEGHYCCGIYADRPRTCRDFTRAGANCLAARRKLGLAI
jgi:hypothetical protein